MTMTEMENEKCLHCKHAICDYAEKGCPHYSFECEKGLSPVWNETEKVAECFEFKGEEEWIR